MIAFVQSSPPPPVLLLPLTVHHSLITSCPAIPSTNTHFHLYGYPRPLLHLFHLLQRCDCTRYKYKYITPRIIFMRRRHIPRCKSAYIQHNYNLLIIFDSLLPDVTLFKISSMQCVAMVGEHRCQMELFERYNFAFVNCLCLVITRGDMVTILLYVRVCILLGTWQDIKRNSRKQNPSWCRILDENLKITIRVQTLQKIYY